MLENDHFGGNWSFSNMSNSSLEFAKSGSSVIKWVSEADLCLFPHIGRNCPAAQVRHLHKGVKPTSRPENTMCVVTHWFGNFRSQWKFWLESSCSDNSADHVHLYLHHVHLSCRLPLPCRACSCGMQMQMEKCGMCSFFAWDEYRISCFLNDISVSKWYPKYQIYQMSSLNLFPPELIQTDYPMFLCP